MKPLFSVGNDRAYRTNFVCAIKTLRFTTDCGLKPDPRCLRSLPSFIPNLLVPGAAAGV